MSPIRPADQKIALEETTHEAMTEALIRSAGKRIVDIGCGEGVLTRYLATVGGAVIGIDPDRTKVDAARVAADESANAAEFLTGVGEALTFADGALDVVIYSNSLHHVPTDKMRRALAEAVRVLKPGGFLYVMEPVAEGPFFEVQKLWGDETEVRARAYEALMDARKRLGLRLVEERFYGVARRFDDYDDLAVRIGGRSAANARTFALNGEAIRARFEELARREEGARPEAGAYLLDMGFRVDLLAKPG